ncbi:MAG: PQQ-dependent dehydrogenase, methanol/ethanol family [Hyphomonadaceae bacterium]|nr:PQQ-dependent dehydrogenase, methanol/ethanol family [Hyphomonadaceae bacterium]
MSRQSRYLGLAALVMVLLPSAEAAVAADVTAQRIVAADKEPGNWLSHGRTYSEQRFSPLAKINPANVEQLGLAWWLDIKSRTTRGVEATPIVVDGIIYTTGAWSHVLAIEAKTGKMLWEFDPQISGEHAAKGCCDVVNRGVAVWGGKVFLGAFDGRLIALDAKSGAKIWETLTVDQSQDYTITGAPRVVKGKVLIGNGGAEFGVRGYVSAYDADTGKMAWRFYTVPGNPKDGFESKTVEMIAKTWSGEWWKYGGGGTVWDSMAYDPDLDLLYVGVGNGSTWNYKIRSDGKGDNLFLSSIVAVRPDTGEYVWHFQTTPGEDWDYTATQHMILVDLMIDGRLRKCILQAPKNGFFYVLDRETGAFISGTAYGTVTWAEGLDPKTGRPIEKAEARWSTLNKPALVLPGPLGAHNWQPMSYSPQTGYVYIPAIEAGFGYTPVDPKTFERRLGIFWNIGLDPVGSAIPDDEATRKAIRASTKGRLVAWDPIARKPAWTIEHPLPWNGGLLSTAGGLLFQGNGQGRFVAYEAATGKTLWDFPTQTGIVAAPVTYEVDGEQYVTVNAGWGGAAPTVVGEIVLDAAKGTFNRVLTFKLGAKAELPPLKTAARVLDPPPATAPAEKIAEGKRLYQTYCMMCHGDTAVSGGMVPDLRYSATLASADAWKSIVLDGTMVKNGMIAFARHLKADDVETLRAYIVQRAHDEKKRLANP